MRERLLFRTHGESVRVRKFERKPKGETSMTGSRPIAGKSGGNKPRSG